MPAPSVSTETAPGGGTRTTLSYSDGTTVRITKGQKGTAVKTTTPNGKSTTTFTNNEGDTRVVEGGNGGGEGGGEEGGEE